MNAHTPNHSYRLFRSRSAKHKRSGQGGFTLVEMLIVFVVVFMLTALLLPAFSRVRDSVSMSKSASHLRQNGVAFSAFAAENGGMFPVGVDFGGDPFGMKGTDTGHWGWYTYLSAFYFGGGKRFDGKMLPYDPSMMVRMPPEMNYGYFHHYMGYGYNRGLFGGYTNKDGVNLKSGKSFTQIRNPSLSPLLWTDICFDGAGYNEKNGGTPSARGAGGGQYRFAYPYNGKGLIMMADGAVSTLEQRGKNRAPDYPEYNWDM